MNLSISNIAWEMEMDQEMYIFLKAMGYDGVEIAPTRIFPQNPYDFQSEAVEWADQLHTEYGLVVPSMQSIWYGKNERIWGSSEERNSLIQYTKKAIDFAQRIRCKNLVFGCPKNRVMPENGEYEIAVSFFRELGEYAARKGTVIGLEANPPIYNTNFVNSTVEAIQLIKAVDSDGFRLNLDTGTMIENGESLGFIEKHYDLINHVHISEPNLNMIKPRILHKELIDLLSMHDYEGFVSIEMKKAENINELKQCVEYLYNLVKR